LEIKKFGVGDLVLVESVIFEKSELSPSGLTFFDI
jgi:hypothetical protein